jgi:hypothetical protein
MVFTPLYSSYIMSENESQSSQPASGGNNAHIYYIIGAVVLVAVIAVGYFLRPQQALAPVSTGGGTTAGAETEAPAATEPITGLECGQQYYNSVVGVDGSYYLSVEGADVSDASSVTCTITAEVNDEEVASREITANLVSAPARGGKTFKCTTEGLKLTPQVPTKVIAEIVDDLGESAACFRYFNLP